MSMYLNVNNIDFQQALDSEIYIDKTELIGHTNKVLNTEQKFVCVSRPRRFGKSMAVKMLNAYYSRGCDSKEMFSSLKISSAESFEKHLNKYNVIKLNMVDFNSEAENVDEMIRFIEEDISEEIMNEYSDIAYPKRLNLVKILNTVFNETNVPFVFLIDEWDCIFRERKLDTEGQRKYLEFLRNLLKDKSFVALAYMTGILPIKKYGVHSAINMFMEVSMTDPREYAEFTGFTENEVMELCKKYDMSFEETKKWYNGYDLMGVSIYNPRSVVMSMTGGYFNNYWTHTETYKALKDYIIMNFDGLNEKVTQMIAGGEIEIDINTFQNDMSTFESADDVLTLLIHLGYLTYDFYKKTVRIPNSEIQQEFINSIKNGGWEKVMEAIRSSEELLTDTINGNEEKVAQAVSKCHSDNTSIIKYNDENSLACVITLAYYSARKNYTIIREFPSGKGYADMVFLPKKTDPNPALVVELKYDKNAQTAIDQIREKNYTASLADHEGEILLVGINYDKDSKVHECRIEKIRK